MRRLSLSILIPIIFFVIASLAQGLLFWRSIDFHQQSLITHTQQRVEHFSKRINGFFRLERSQQQKNENFLNLLTYLQPFHSIMLIGSNLHILLDSNHQYQGESIESVNDYFNSKVFEQAIHTGRAQWYVSGNGLMGTFYDPVITRHPSGIAKQVFLVEYDLGHEWSLIFRRLLVQALWQWGLIMLGALVMNMLIRRWLVKPLKQISINDIHLPQFPSKPFGRGEVAQFGHFLNDLRSSLSTCLSQTQAAESRWQFALDSDMNGIWEWDLVTDKVHFNQQWAQMLKLSAQQLANDIGGWQNYIHSEDKDETLKQFRLYMQGVQDTFMHVHRLVNAQGEIIWVSPRVMMVEKDDDRPLRMVGLFKDISELHRAQEKLVYQSNYDSTTKLANRSRLLEELEQAIDSHAEYQEFGGLFYIDIDNFKNINDLFGHHIGDFILKKVARRLEIRRSHVHTVARISGDEFAILLTHLGQVRQHAVRKLLSIAHQLSNHVRETIEIQNSEVNLNVTIGIALFPHQNNKAYEVFRQADIALYHGKEAGRSKVHFFIEEMASKAHQRHEIQMLMPKAMNNDDMVIYFQPRFNDSYQMTGAETLLRWFDERYGWISPGVFIPMAEESGFVVELGEWVMRGACRKLKQWQDKGIPVQFKTLSVNVSPKQFHRSGFVQEVIDIINQEGCDPTLLELEITEGVLVTNVDETITKLSELRDFGVRFSIDDFGTGYSSLAYLNRLPINCLKIDKSFVDEVVANGTRAGSSAIIATIIAMSENLGIEVVAEGVETDFQMHFLKYRGCRTYQGFLFSEALEPDIFEQLLFNGKKPI